MTMPPKPKPGAKQTPPVGSGRSLRSSSKANELQGTKDNPSTPPPEPSPTADMKRGGTSLQAAAKRTQDGQPVISPDATGTTPLPSTTPEEQSDVMAVDTPTRHPQQDQHVSPSDRPSATKARKTNSPMKEDQDGALNQTKPNQRNTPRRNQAVRTPKVELPKVSNNKSGNYNRNRGGHQNRKANTELATSPPPTPSKESKELPRPPDIKNTATLQDAQNIVAQPKDPHNKQTKSQKNCNCNLRIRYC